MASLAALARRFDCELELYASHTSTITHAMPPAITTTARSTGFALRVIKARRLGFAAFENPRHIERALRRALKLARLGEARDYWFSTLRGSSDAWHHPMHEHRLLDAFEALTPLRVRLLNKALGAARIVQRLTTSQGARLEQRSTLYSGHLTVASNGLELTLAEESAALDWRPRALTRRAEELALLARRRMRAQRGVVEVVLDARAVGQLLATFAAHNWSGDALQRGATRLKPGEAVAGEAITLLDNPLLAKAAASARWDDEGAPARRRALIERGRVKEFLWDMQSAARASLRCGGCARRASYATPPSAAPSTLELVPGRLRDAVAECARGVYVLEFLAAHEVNAVTGDWSLPIGVGYVIRRGELVAALRGATLTGNLFEALRALELERTRERHGAVLAPRAHFTARITA